MASYQAMQKRMIGPALIFVSALAMGALFATAASSSTVYIYVTRTDDPAVDGCAVNGCSLREAAGQADATAGEQVVDIAGGQTVTLTQGPVVISGETRIAGHEGSAVTSDGALIFQVAASGDAGIENLRIFGANAGGCGGGIRNEGMLELTNVTIEDNSVTGTGGGLCNMGTLTISGSTITGNTVMGSGGGGDGGGLYNAEGATLTVQYSTISDNTGQSSACDECSSGGGISNDGAMTLEWSTVANNHGDTGAGMENGGSATVRRTTFSGNQAGAILNSGGATMSLSNSTVSGNLASPYPDNGVGGISNYGSLSLTNVTVANNTNLQFQFGGLFNGTTGSADYKATIFSNNGQKNCNTGGSHISAGYNVFDDDTCAEVGTDQVVGDAMIGPLADNGGPTLTHLPLAGSPAIDEGSPGCPSPDQRGALRVNGCDVGAAEYGSTPPTPSPTPSPTPAPDAYPIGDASCDDRVTAEDVAPHLRVAGGVDEPDDCGRDTIPCIEYGGACYPVWLDTDCNGVIDGRDVLWVMYFNLGMFEGFDGCTPVGEYPGQ